MYPQQLATTPGGENMLRGAVLLLLLLTWAPSPGAPRFDPGLPHPVRPLPFFYDLYTFRGDERTTTVVAAFAVPVRRLERESRDHGVRYRFDVTLVLADTALRSVSRTDDSVFVVAPRPLSGDHLLHTHIEVRAPPSRTTLQRVVMTDASTPGIGQLYGSAFPIPDYGGTQLMLSDIALGRPGATVGWQRGNVVLALLPTSQFPEGSFDVYYEVYNLPAGHRYATEISVERMDETGSEDPSGSGAVRTLFTGEAATRPDGTLPELRRVDTSLPKGRYRLTVEVTDQATGQSAERSRTFHVRGGGWGATMVPALRRGRTTPTP